MRAEDERIIEGGADNQPPEAMNDQPVAQVEDGHVMYDSEDGEPPIPSHLPEYHQRRQQAINIAQFESFSTDKQRRIERRQGPLQLSTDRVVEFEEDTEEDKVGVVETTRLYNDVVGRMFLHPINTRLYEVLHLYWDRRSKQIAVLRRVCDPMIVDPDDRLAYPLRGDRGVLRLIERYETQAGYAEAARWPTSESMMLDQQRLCPILHL